MQAVVGAPKFFLPENITIVTNHEIRQLEKAIPD
jgi:hypothetical protein